MPRADEAGIFWRERFNTASGMDCMQLAIFLATDITNFSFNTASGMDCMQ